MNNETYASIKPIVKRFGISEPTLLRWVKKGIFPKPVKLSAGCSRWKLSDIEAWEAEKKEVA